MTEWQFCEQYLLENDPETVENLLSNLSSIIDCTLNHDLKLGLKIILILLSHPHREIRALSLGNLFFLISENDIQKIIIHELKMMTQDSEATISSAANYSLENIANHVSPFELIDYLNYFMEDIESQIQLKIQDLKHSLSSKNIEISEKELKNHPHLLNLYHELDHLFYQLLLFSDQFETKILDISPSEFSWEEYEKGVLHFSEINQLYCDPHEPLKKLSTVYGATFREKRHILRLKGYLDDDDPEIKMIGIEELSKIAYLLLRESHERPVVKINTSLDPSAENQSLQIKIRKKLYQSIYFFK